MPLVLVVDATNQTHSPLCEALGNARAAKEKREGLVFDSCGWSVDYPERLAAGIRGELERRKLPLDSFRTKRLESALADKAAVILCFDEKLAGKVKEAYPLRASKVIVAGGVQELKGVAAEDYKACAEAVQKALDTQWAKIISFS